MNELNAELIDPAVAFSIRTAEVEKEPANRYWWQGPEDGIPALALQRALEIGSYQTAWAMLHRLRSVLVRPGRNRLTGSG